MAVFVLRFEQLRKDQEEKLKAWHDQSAELTRSRERPFSFYKADLARAASREKSKKDPNRFQRPFKANPVPASMQEVRIWLGSMNKDEHTCFVNELRLYTRPALL